MLNQDFKEFIQSLNDNHVRYLVVGGYAIALHGHPRYTKDLDVWIEMAPKNAVNVIKALKQFGFGSLGLKEENFLVPDQIIQLGHPPNRIDLLSTLSGVELFYQGQVTTGVGRPGTAPDIVAAGEVSLASDFIPAPNAPLTLQGTTVGAHMVRVRLPIQ